jgi:hypothetical protein
VDEIMENVLVALAARVRFSYTDFEEDGAGDGHFGSSEYADSFYYSSPYTQRAMYTDEYWLLSLPFAFEWNINQYVAWRFGADFRAKRLEQDGELWRDIVLAQEEGFDDILPFKEVDHSIEYDTRTYLSMGLTFSFRDRLALDVLTAVSAGGFNAANVTTAWLKFCF